MKIERNKDYLRIKTVVMEDGEVAYIEGRTYPSRYDGCITDEQDDECHQWNDKCDVEDYFCEAGAFFPVFLDWEGVKSIVNIADGMLRECHDGKRTGKEVYPTEKDYYKEVLARFIKKNNGTEDD